MVTRPEAIQICEELKINHDGLSTEEMKDQIKKTADKKFAHKRVHISADNLSIALRKFLSLEYNYTFKDKDGNEYDYKGDKIKL